MTEITMPRLTDQMEEATILKWLVEDGGSFEVGDDLLEIETDKATITYQAEIGGTLQIVEPEGAVVEVGAVIARAAGTGSAVDAPPATAPSEEPAPAPPPAPVATEQPAADATPAPALQANGHAPAATPLARRIAAQHGIDLASVAGTGPRGRITKQDVLAKGGIQLPETVAPPRPAPPSAGGASRDAVSSAGTVIEPSRIQAVVARRMAEAKATIPHFQVATEARMDRVMRLREELRSAVRDGDPVPSFNDFVLRAAALALRGHPLVNGSYVDGRFELHEQVNVGIAVAADAGLVVVTVPDADVRSLGEIARSSRALAAKVRDNTVTAPELTGATFTVSNLGMYGMTEIIPVINPPQAAILGVGAMRPTLARVDGEIVDQTLMTLTLSCDHRILNGADAAAFLSEVRERLEEPLTLAF